MFLKILITNFSKVVLTCAIGFLNFGIFLSFSDFSDHHWPTKLLSLTDGLHDKTPETKKWF